MNTTEQASNDVTVNTMNYSTYCPEDNKLRLYVGRVPRDEYEALRADGWTSTPKQDCDFVAHWTPQRAETARNYSDVGEIEDEDQSPEERAADRAERFGEYRDKRLDEATGHADRFDGQPQAHGYQNYAKAVRAADRHDRIADRALSSWDKAEYWTRRTAGVISHALYVSRPEVRMGRIKELEAEIRRQEKTRADYAETHRKWTQASEEKDPEKQNRMAKYLAQFEHGDYLDPRTGRKASLYTFFNESDLRYNAEKRASEEIPLGPPVSGADVCALWLSTHPALGEEGPWLTHYRLRLAYENQMLEAQGGRLAHVEIEPGGKIGGKLIMKVNKSPATGRVTSVDLKGPKVQGWTYKAKNVPGTDYAVYQFDTERMAPGAYVPPTDESRAELAALREEKKAAAPKIDCPLINPTDEDAQKLQDIWNEEAADRAARRQTTAEPSKVIRVTQAEYSARSGGTYSHWETLTVCETGHGHRSRHGRNLTRCDVFKIRKGYAPDYAADRVIIITDKPQKPIPWAKIEAARAKCPTVEKMRPQIAEVHRIMTEDHHDCGKHQIIKDAEYVGWIDATTVFPAWTKKGHAALAEWRASQAAPATVQPALL